MARPTIIDGGLQAQLGFGNIGTDRYFSPAFQRLEWAYFDQQSSIRIPKGHPHPPRPERRCFKAGEESLGTVPDQDAHNYARVQKGLQSRGISEVILGEQELLVRHFRSVLDRHLRDEPHG